MNLAKIEALAPDQAALVAARKLLKPAAWPTLACDGAGLIWGEAQGSGATPYRVVVAEADAGYKCTCPSRKFPCKHSLALMWMRAEGKVAFAPGSPPQWVNDWRSRRRGPSQGAAAKDAAPKGSVAKGSIAKGSIAAAISGGEEAVASNPKAEARAAAQRERNRQDREAAILAGLDELDLWLSDQLDRGIAAFVANAAGACRAMVQRLVDAKASALATRLDSLPSRLFSLGEAARPKAAVVELGLFHLLAEAYRRQDALDPALREDVRQMIGWTQTREALLADPNAMRAAGRWHVIATRNEVQPDKLRRMETWLWREGEGARCALLLDFVPVSVSASSMGFMVGETFEAELVFHASPVPLRALIATQTSPSGTGEAMPMLPEAGLAAAWQAYEQALGARPWLGDWPFLFKGARVRRNGEALFLTDPAEANLALPISPDQAVSALPLAQAGPVDGVGIWDGWRIRITQAKAELGRWVDA
ncbi:MAG TPA: SWIM zinc finger family protein [Xanthobacteraceae bacterium]